MKETYLVIAYMAVWIGLSIYVATLAQRQKKLALRIDALNKRLKSEED